MKVWIRRGAAVALILMLSAAAPAELPIRTLLSDAGAARTFDYWRLREGRDTAAIEALRKAAFAEMGVGDAEEPKRCLTEAEIEIQIGLTGASNATSEAVWRQDRDAAAAAVRRFDVALAAVLDGRSSGDASLDDFIKPYLARAKTAKTARGRDLALRTARDQAMRKGFENDAMLGVLEPSARRLTTWPLWNRMCRIDADNVAWIKREVRARGWFKISEHGVEAEKDAWLLAQHADNDSAFQIEVLTLLDKLRLNQETDPKSYGYLYDRVAINTGRPQRYGTQGGCKDGERFTALLEDPANVDRLRAEVGMTSLAEYNALFRCQKPDS